MLHDVAIRSLRPGSRLIQFFRGLRLCSKFADTIYGKILHSSLGKSVCMVPGTIEIA